MPYIEKHLVCYTKHFMKTLLTHSDASFQNLPTKHSQAGFCVFLADGDYNVDLIHFHRSRAPIGGHSTEQTELVVLDLAFKAMENISCLTNDLLKGAILVVAYINCGALLSNLMNQTFSTELEMRYRREGSMKKYFTIFV